MDVDMIQAWELWASESEGRFFHVGHRKFVELCGWTDPIVPVLVSIKAEGRGPDKCYYGWQDKGEEEKPPSMIWPHWATFSICFPCDPEELKEGGRVVQLNVVRREHLCENCRHPYHHGQKCGYQPDNNNWVCVCEA